MSAPFTPPSREGDRHDPTSNAVLIPLIISMLLVLIGVGIAVTFYVLYRRRYRSWLVEFTARRERERREEEEKERKGKIGPAWWEVEVGDEDEEGEWWGGMDDVEKGWNVSSAVSRDSNVVADEVVQPVAVAYRSDPTSFAENVTATETQGTRAIEADSKLASSTSLSTTDDRPETVPEKVEMTVLIAMPSPSPTRSRRSSPASSVPSLTSSSTKGCEEERIEEVWEDELPEVQLATVVIPVTEDRILR